MISFKVNKKDSKLIERIVKRATAMFKGYDAMDISMDICATHCNGNPIDLQKLLKADDFNFAHDVGGIRACLDRRTGKLINRFTPRCSKPPQA